MVGRSAIVRVLKATASVSSVQFPECYRLLYVPCVVEAPPSVESACIFSKEKLSSPSPCLSELPGIPLSVFSPSDTVVHEALLSGAKDCSQPAQPFKEEPSQIEHVKLGS